MNMSRHDDRPLDGPVAERPFRAVAKGFLFFEQFAESPFPTCDIDIALQKTDFRPDLLPGFPDQYIQFHAIDKIRFG